MEKNEMNITAGMQEAYEAKIGAEMLDRVGHNVNGKGVVHELLYRDKLNVDPSNILQGKHAELTSSTTAIRDDLVVKQGGKVVQRFQLKDTPNSVEKTLQQTCNHKYSGTNLFGTEETTKAYTQKAATRGTTVQKMTSTGISSKDTERIANKALGKSVSPDCLLSGVKNAGKVGGIVSAGLTALSLITDDEDHDCQEVIEETAKSAAVGATSGAAGFAAGECLAGLIAASNPIAGTAAAIGGAVVASDVAATFVKPVAEGFSTAIHCKNPAFIGYGIQEGIDDVIDRIPPLSILSGLFGLFW